MNARWCHRCHGELAAQEDGTLQFCSHCGAPQLRLSEELKERAELRQTQGQTPAEARSPVAAEAGEAPGTQAAATTALPATEVPVWHTVLRFVALSAGISMLLAVLAALAGPVLLIGWLWAVVSPIVLLGLFHSRYPAVPITTGFGSRLGLVAGLANAAALSTMYGLELFIARRAHMLVDFDKNMQNSIHDMQAQVIAQSAGQDAAAALHWVHSLNVPEFRAGMLLAGVGLLIVLLVIVSTAGGAFAGFMRSRSA